MGVQLVPSHARWSFQAGSASLTQFQFCSINTSNQLVAPATGVYAVVLDDAPSNAGATYDSTKGTVTGGYSTGVYYGVVLPVGCVSKVIFGATLATPGTAVMTDASGHAIAAVTGAVVLGWTIAPQSSGDIAAIVLNVAALY